MQDKVEMTNLGFWSKICNTISNALMAWSPQNYTACDTDWIDLDYRYRLD